MAEEKTMRLSQVARKLNVGTTTIIEYLASKGFQIESKPNTKITLKQFNMLAKEFASSVMDKEEASEVTIGGKYVGDITLTSTEQYPKKEPEEATYYRAEAPKLPGLKTIGKIDIAKASKTTQTAPPPATPKAVAIPDTAHVPAETSKEKETGATEQRIERERKNLKGLTVLGKIEVHEADGKKFRQVASSDKKQEKGKRPRKRIQPKEKLVEQKPPSKAKEEKEGVSEKEIQEQIKATLAKLGGGKKGRGSRAKYRREKRVAIAEAQEEKLLQGEKEAKILKVTEFVSANDLASLMGVSINEVLSTCMTLGMVTSINQRLDAEAITVIADEFGYKVVFTEVKEEAEEEKEAEEEQPENLIERAPIVTIMGHVDHGKTSLLDYIRNTSVIATEAGGITQHIGAYDVVTDSGKRIAFLDTPGHEAFTAMRARGAKITDVAIIVVAADDSVMSQTKEAINHAQVAGVPIVIAINKIDKPQANPDKIKEDLSNNNILVEDWGGKYQSQEISAKTGKGVNELLEKVLLEAELLELKASPNKKATGTVLEASLDKGRGYVSTVMVQEGTLKTGDVMLVGMHYGKIKAMFDHRGNKIKEAKPSTPVQVLGINGAPQAGDSFKIMNTERIAREIATKRQQILREQNFRTKTHITLDQVGERLAIGNFKEFNIILKGDVDGSIEALSDALLKLSTKEININIILRGVGQISESDILLASASDAIIIGFQVRPSVNARKLAEKEGIEIRLYSIIYDVINEVKDAMEGMLAPSVEEVITGTAEVRETFKISKVGTVAGCYVTDGSIKKAKKIRLIRDGIVIYTGNIHQLKRFKDDVPEVKTGFECGMSIKNFNDIKTGDVIEGFEEKEVKRERLSLL
ncbi:MAG: translation initiation factor IF-2 [Cytophagales bacterium]|nr:translation initiation factor IF-2 [Cytophagales bacterium]